MGLAAAAARFSWVAGLVASGLGLTSAPDCADVSETVMDVEGAVTVTLMGVAVMGASGPVRLAMEPPSADAYTVPSGMGTIERISGRFASYRTKALSLAPMR